MREERGLPLSFILHALLPGFEILSALSCSQSSASEIANLFQPLLRPPLPRDCRLPSALLCSDLRFPEIASDALSPYPLSAMRAVSSSNTSPRPNLAYKTVIQLLHCLSSPACKGIGAFRKRYLSRESARLFGRGSCLKLDIFLFLNLLLNFHFLFFDRLQR